jgi:predicted DNA-binding ribbon-helix-helix protein
MTLRKRSLSLDRHRTSVSLEPIFWMLLERCAAERGLSLAALVAEIDRARVAAGGGDNLSSAVRVWLVERLLATASLLPQGEGGGAAAG